jgi:predicted PurR-regulated permease PerM
MERHGTRTGASDDAVEEPTYDRVDSAVDDRPGEGPGGEEGPGEEGADEGSGDEQPAGRAVPAPVRRDDHLGEPGEPLRHGPFYLGLMGGLGLLTAWWLGQQLAQIGSILILIVVSMFLAAGLDPVVEFFMRRGLRRPFAVLAVIVLVVGALALFVTALVPVISDQVASLTANAPGWLDRLQENDRIQGWNRDYEIIQKVQEYIAEGDYSERVFGGVLGFGLAVLSAVFNAFVVVVLTLYFMASLPTTKAAFYRLAPASRRDRISRLGDRVIRGVGGYVSGAFVVSVTAAVASLVFLMVIGLGEYAVALSFVVGLLSLIPMIGATIAMVLVSAIGFTESVTVGLVCLVFYAAYQQVENYFVYPRVMQRSVDVPGSVTVIAALVGAALLGVVGALLAVPTAAAILLVTREVFVRRQDGR